jgi:hypothetical protein
MVPGHSKPQKPEARDNIPLPVFTSAEEMSLQ